MSGSDSGQGVGGRGGASELRLVLLRSDAVHTSGGTREHVWGESPRMCGGHSGAGGGEGGEAGGGVSLKNPKRKSDF